MRDGWLFVKFKLTVYPSTLELKTIIHNDGIVSSLSIKAVRNCWAAICLSSNMTEQTTNMYKVPAFLGKWLCQTSPCLSSRPSVT